MSTLSKSQFARLAAYLGYVRNFPVTIKRITTTDDGRLQLVLEAQSMDDHNLAQVQSMLELQRGAALLTLVAAQGSLFDEVPKAEEAQSSE